MKNAQIIRDLEKAYNASFGTKATNHFKGSDLQSESFARILGEITLRAARQFYSFAIKNKCGSWATFICPCSDGCIPGSESLRKNDKVTVLLHWGMRYEFLDDLMSWGHEKCTYKVDDVPYGVVLHFTEEHESNYWTLYDAVVNYKETGEWFIPEPEKE